jgi:Domain of unknown function (DUF4926)
MIITYPKLLDTVAILSLLSLDRLIQVEPDTIPNDGLPIGLVGTIVEIYPELKTYLVEFADAEGREYAMAILPADQLLIVHLDLTSNYPDLVAA